jgi:hypothetical protein
VNRLIKAASAAALLCAFNGQVAAQSANGFASIVQLPVVVSSATFHSTMLVHNPNAADTAVRFTYYGANGTALAGEHACGDTTIPAGSTVQLDVAELCSLTGASGSQFGSLRAYELSDAVRPIGIYSRVQAFSGNGFSVEGFPIGNFANDLGESVVLGLVNQAAAPGYQTNCFVSSLGEAVTVDMVLKDASNAQLGSAQSFSLGANEMIRVVDVFTAVGAPAGDYTNVRAEFTKGVTNGNPSYAAFCTVQNNTSFDADFRIAKTVRPDDATVVYSATQNKDGMGNLLAVPAGAKQIFGVYLRHPDFVSCRVVGNGNPNLEVRLVDPSGAVAAGGDDVEEFSEFYLGEKSTRGDGSNGMWKVEVGSRDGLGSTNYVLKCTSGNGANRPILIGNVADDF